MLDILTMMLRHVYAASPTTEEMNDAHGWASENSNMERPEPPFSFLYDEVPSGELLKTWDFQCSEEELDEHRSQRTTTFTDSKTGLQVRCAFVIWKNYPTVEWTAYFKNNGDTNTPILSSIQAIDTAFDRGPDGELCCIITSATNVPSIALPRLKQGLIRRCLRPSSPMAAARATVSGHTTTSNVRTRERAS